MSKNKYWRLTAIFSAIFISLFFGFSTFLVPKAEQKLYLMCLIPIGIFMIASIIHQMRFPLDLRVYVLWTYLFSFLSFAYGSSAQALIIFYCAYILGTEFRFFGKNKKLKLAIATILLCLSGLYQFRLPQEKLMSSLMEILVSISALVSMNFIMKHMLGRISKDIFLEARKENLEDYFSQDNFTDRDKVMLREVLSGCKYEEIALNHKLSLSSVKKRLAFLYKKVGVTNQIDFIIKFSGKEPVSAEKDSSGAQS